MTKKEIDDAWEAASGDLKAAIGMALDMGLARQKGKSAKEVKRDFFVEIAKIAWDAGCKRGYAQGKLESGA